MVLTCAVAIILQRPSFILFNFIIVYFSFLEALNWNFSRRDFALAEVVCNFFLCKTS